jgi:ABC-2 type transport system permease protein
MHHIFRIAQALLSVYYAHMVEYRAELLLWALSNSLPFILMGAWIQASQSASFGFTAIEFAQYFLAAFIVRQFNVVWVIWDFEKEVVSGQLSNRLLQPLDPFWHHFAGHVAERFARFPFIIALIGLFFALYPQSFWVPSLSTFLTFIFVVTIAFCLRFLTQYTFALFAFWTERASAIEQFWFLLYLFLSGMIAPLDVFPTAVQEVLQWTPFPYMIYFPSALLMGRSVNLVQGVLVISVWTILFFCLNRWLWRRGLRHYSGMGA